MVTVTSSTVLSLWSENNGTEELSSIDIFILGDQYLLTEIHYFSTEIRNVVEQFIL